MFARRRNAACRGVANKAETESGANKVNSAKVGMPSVNYSYTKIPQSRFFWNLRKRRFSTGEAAARSNERVSLKLSAASTRWNKTASLISRLKRR